MKKSEFRLSLLLFLTGLICFGQMKPFEKKIKISGKVVEKTSKQPLEYATITLKKSKNPKLIVGGITNEKGEFTIAIDADVYDISIEFISFKIKEIKQKDIQENTSLGLIALEEDASQLNEVVVRSEKTTVEIKLDKKVYNVGKDLLVKGGTVSDVLDNIPSVSVDVEGVVSLRGNQNVRILIDGRPSNAINIAEALRQIPADAIEKVEVITNPSARYDAEGGGGLLNIILKKGKNLGLNGTFITSMGIPESYGASANLNYKLEKINFFTNTGYNYRNNPGKGLNNTEYLNTDSSTKSYIDEDRKNERLNKSFNSNLGMEWAINTNTYWTNTFNYRKGNGENTDNVNFNNYDLNRNYLFTRTRINNEITEGNNIEYTSNFLKNFDKKGHKLTVDFTLAKNNDVSNSYITDQILYSTATPEIDRTFTDQDQKKEQIQADYVLPLGEGSQFEAGYKGDFSELLNEYYIDKIDQNGTIIPKPLLSNTLEYKEKVNALYAQYGFKKSKFSYLFGLRWEDSNIDVNQLATNEYNKKRYNNFFPSAFITYEIAAESSISMSYSKRVSRPRGRFMNPFTNYSSNINLFRGNPDLDPSMTDKYDFGYIKRWDKITFNTSLYYENNTNDFTFVRLETGEFVNGIPVILTKPINLATKQNIGFEFTLNYTPYKWWKLNGNFNMYKANSNGDFSYTNSLGQEINQNFDYKAFSWFTRINSRVTLPYKIEWQTNASYNGPENYAQGKSFGQFGANLAFSKDFLKDKGTLSLNINDVFNSRIRKTETFIPGSINSYSEMQFRPRSINLSFTYRFNKQKNEREKQPKRNQGDGEGEFQG
jgi:outer membrane receptor for ferrienterochelin and colicins